MLELINEARVDQGLAPLVLGHNPAAQLHAESSLEHCFSSHWGIDGLKPYMRYSLNGGYQSNVENTSGDDYCIEESDGYPPIASVEQEIRDSMEGWMDNPDQRRNILDPSYKKVSIGLAWDRYDFNAVQHFEGDFVDYDRLPTIEHGALAVSGTAKNGVRFEKDQDLTVQIYFDPPPHALTRGQVIRTDCYRGGINVASLRSSASGDADDEYTTSHHKPCPDPYDVPLDAPVPLSVEESQEIRRAVYRASQASGRRSITASWITARWWNVDGASFEVTADIDALLLQYGDGVYTVVVWAPLGGRQVPISRYSIFHGITPPETHTAVPAPTSTPTAASTPVPTSTPTPVPTATPIPLSTPMPVPTSTPTPVSTPVPTGTAEPSSTPSSAPVPNLRHIEEKRYMLQLINEERVKAGVAPVILGDNVAAQLHAESALENCFSSHWGIDGLKPYMRYSLAGDYQSNGENGYGRDYCITVSQGYRAIASIDEEIREAMEDWMDSPDHRANILRPWHKKVNIGLAWDSYNISAAQHFEGDYIEYDQLPSIEGGVLSVSGNVKNGVHFRNPRDLSVMIFYDPPPHPLTQGQVSRTYCYDSGRPIAGLRRPLSGGQYYRSDQFTRSHSPCPNPYDVASDAPAPGSHDEAHAFWQAAYDASQARETQNVTASWITASKWMATKEGLVLEADLEDLLERHGAGVYSIIMWGRIGGEDVVVSEYSIFHGITVPDTYD